MIYITGDCHGTMDIDKVSEESFTAQQEMTDKDFLIICGDMGITWNYPNSDDYEEDLKLIDWWSNRNFTTLFIDGNHENHELLNSYEITEYCGGRVHKIADKIYHLMRGEIFIVDGNKLFAFGGASSIERLPEEFKKTWWKEELPTVEEMNYGLSKLQSFNYDVDYVLTHAGPIDVVNELFKTADERYKIIPDCIVDYFQKISEKLKFKKWYFGHYHCDTNSKDEKYICLYNNIVNLGDKNLIDKED